MYGSCLLCHTLPYLLEQRPNGDSVEDIDRIYDIAVYHLSTCLRPWKTSRLVPGVQHMLSTYSLDSQQLRDPHVAPLQVFIELLWSRCHSEA